MPSLGGAGRLGQFGQSVAAGYERQQEYLNALHKARLDALSMSVSPVMMCSSNAPPKNLNIRPGQMIHVQKTATEVAMQQQQAGMAQVTDMAVRSMQVKNLLNNLLPEVCREHVYKCDHEHSIVDDCEIVKWTFFNDLSVRMKVDAEWVLNEGDVEPLVEDFELWQADAIMKCEAGDDVWPRPKPGVENVSSGPSQQQMQNLQNLQQQAAASQVSGLMNQQALGNHLSNALGLGGLFK